ncbi:MAG: FGGY family carbohydrate kinase [Balneolales bacterium]
MYTIGFDVGSSSIKAALLDIESGKITGSATYPETEMAIAAPQPGWAEQEPVDWWDNIKAVTRQLQYDHPSAFRQVKAVGITYQMHGLVMVGKDKQVLRPSIIWCDSRAVEIGNKACKALGEPFCLENFLNSPGNFTAAKLRWVQENEPELFHKADKIMLPGDYIAMMLSGEITTTVSGLSEGILWNFRQNTLAHDLLDHWEIDPSLIADLKGTFSEQARISKDASAELGIPAGTPIAYRAGDQPNNAFSLNVLEPGEVATTAGTSGVVYGILDEPAYDPASRVNAFVHVNHTPEKPRYGVLLCINGTGILNSWMRKNMFSNGQMDYHAMNDMAAQVKPGSEGVMVFPFGNGAERSLGNRDTGAAIQGISFNRHDQRHLCRAGQEGIVYALAYGMEIMQEMGIRLETIKAGKANMFLSPVFREAFVNTTGAELRLYDTDGAAGAARGAAVGGGLYASLKEAFTGLEDLGQQQPEKNLSSLYQESYGCWKDQLEVILNQH